MPETRIREQMGDSRESERKTEALRYNWLTKMGICEVKGVDLHLKLW